MFRYIVDEVDKLPSGLFDRKVVVTQYDEIGLQLRDKGYEVVENRDSDLGISHSIHLGLEILPEEEDWAYCFAVCDQPYLKAVTIEDLVKGWRISGKGIGCLCNMGELGNPAIYSEIYRKELMELKGDVGGKKVLRRHITDIYLHEVDDGTELVDIDVNV